MKQLLHVEQLSAGYGDAVVLHDVSLSLDEGQTLALLGRNGVGKTTFMDTLAGATRQHGGRITLGGVALHHLPSHARAAAGIGWVPQERNIFKSLTVHENLTAVARPGAWTPQRAYEMFPRLAERKGNLGTQLSGGEQQMLALARALMSRPRLLLMDEPSVGLAPKVVAEIFGIVRKLHAEGTSIFLVEQNVHMALKVAQHFFLLQQGRVTFSGTPADLAEDDVIQRAYLAGSDHARSAAAA